VCKTEGHICLAFLQLPNRFHSKISNYISFLTSVRIIVVFITYFFGCWWLPTALTLLDFEVVKLGKKISSNNKVETKDIDTPADDSGLSKPNEVGDIRNSDTNSGSNQNENDETEAAADLKQSACDTKLPGDERAEPVGTNVAL
jgi:hypothetical protein